MEKEHEYIKLLESIIVVAEAAKGTPAGEDDRVLDAEGLLLKVFCHASSAFYLSRSTTISELNVSFFDVSSPHVLARAALETFLVFHYVFIAPTTKDEKDFRYWAWSLAGLLDRQKYVPLSPQGRKTLAKEKEIIAELQQKLTNNPYLKELKKKKQENILKRGKWRLQSWVEIGLSAGLSERHSRQFYSYLCGHAHASNLSISQISQANTAQIQKDLLSATVGLLMIVMAFMVKLYMMVFSQGENALSEDAERARIVEQWSEIGSHSLEDLDIDWDKTSR